MNDMTAEADTRKTAKKRKTRVEYIKTVAILVLFALMTVLASAEIIQTQLLSISPVEDIDIGSLLVLYDEQPKSSVAAYIMPEFLGYSLGGTTRGLFGGETVMRGIYGVLQNVLAELLTSGVCKTLPQSDGAQVWDSAREGEFIYVCYPHELPASVIAYTVSDGKTELAEGDIPQIRELFLVKSDEAWGLVTRSESGSVSFYSHKPGEEAPAFDESLVTAYNNSRQLADFRFLGDISADLPASEPENDETGSVEGENPGDAGNAAGAETDAAAVNGDGISGAGSDAAPATDGAAVVDDMPIGNAAGTSTGDVMDASTAETDAGDADEAMNTLPDPVRELALAYKLRDTTVLVDGDFSQKYIAVEAGAELTGRILDSLAATELLGLFDINTERVAPYRSQGYTIYLGESGRVRFSDAGGIDYMAVASGAAGMGGVPVSSFLGYENYGGRYTFFELLDAAASLLDKLENVSPDLLGGDAYPGLVSVSATGEGLELVFGYFYDGYRIIGLGTAITMTFSDGALTRLAMTPAKVTKGGACVSLPQDMAILHIYNKIGTVGTQPQPVKSAVLTMAYSVEDAVRKTENPGETQVPETAAENTGHADAEAAALLAKDEQSEPAQLQFSPDWVLLVEPVPVKSEERFAKNLIG